MHAVPWLSYGLALTEVFEAADGTAVISLTGSTQAVASLPLATLILSCNMIVTRPGGFR